ncbi:type IV secretion protein Rhs, partial [Salmonella enterica]|nr:type IV secretion protein Rhs [Salmonella enterica]
ITSPRSDLEQWTFTDPAGNRTAARDKYPVLPESFPDNRISQDVDNVYHYDEHGRLTEKDERRIRPQGSLSHHYGYDNRHRLTHYRQMQQGSVLTESRYLYDPLGRRISKRVWKSQEERDLNGDGYLWLNPTPEVAWYGWDGDRLTTTQTDDTRIQTVYPPGSFTPLIRTETATEALAKTHHRSLAEKLQQDAGMAFVPELVALLDNLERELNAGRVSELSRQWLAQCGLTPEQMKSQMAPAYTPARKIHLYHCDHRGLPLALIDVKGRIAWRAECDEWGNMLREDNPDNLQQLIRLPGQQYDEESGLHYNRHRYYDPGQGRYITQDPTGLAGGWNLYKYPLNPVSGIDPLGLKSMRSDGHPWGYGCGDESTDWIVPDSLGSADFLPACRKHDICYGTLDSHKYTCDQNLGKNMKLACQSDLKGFHKLYRPLCNGMADGYKLAVSKFGQSAYDAAQEK